MPTTALAGYSALAARGVSLAAGEHLQQREAFALLVSQKILAVIQPDLAMIGGLTPVLDLCVLANLMDVVVSPHFLLGLFVHVAAAAPALQWLEDFPLLEPMFEGWSEIKQGNCRREMRSVMVWFWRTDFWRKPKAADDLGVFFR